MKIERLERFKGKLESKGIDAAVIIQPRDLYYYSGTSQPCNLIVAKRGNPILLIRRAEAFVREETCIKNLSWEEEVEGSENV